MNEAERLRDKNEFVMIKVEVSGQFWRNRPSEGSMKTSNKVLDQT